MAIGLLRDIRALCPSGALMGLDIGTKTIGLAVCDPGQTLATPLRTIVRRKFTLDLQDIGKSIKDYDIKGYILGYPLNMDGSAGPRCQSIRHFAEEMIRYPEIVGLDPWIALWDERLSTDFVEDSVGEFVDIRKAKKKGVIDALAARHILQEAIDQMQHNYSHLNN